MNRQNFVRFLACLCICTMFACATTTGQVNLQTRLDDARAEAIVAGADRYCPEEWHQAEMMVRRAAEFQQAGQTETAQNTMRFAVDLYQSAAMCAARARSLERQPFPVPLR